MPKLHVEVSVTLLIRYIGLQVRVLLKMCYHTGKATFASGFGAQMLAYVSATGGKEVHVVNGGGKGGYLSTISSCPIPYKDGELAVHCCTEWVSPVLTVSHVHGAVLGCAGEQSGTRS